MNNKDIFCRIADGEIPCYKLYEDDDVLAFLDISQVTKGHALVIPKKHYKDLTEVDNVALLAELMQVVKDVTKKLGLNEYRVMINNGKSAGQDT